MAALSSSEFSTFPSIIEKISMHPQLHVASRKAWCSVTHLYFPPLGGKTRSRDTLGKLRHWCKNLDFFKLFPPNHASKSSSKCPPSISLTLHIYFMESVSRGLRKALHWSDQFWLINISSLHILVTQPFDSSTTWGCAINQVSILIFIFGVPRLNERNQPWYWH